MKMLRHTARDDEGSVLIAVIGIMVVLTVLAIGAYAMADGNLFQAKRDRGSAQALAAAEAGLEQVSWRIGNQVEPTTTLNFTLPTGNVSVSTSQTTPMTWHLISTGSSNTTPSVSRTVSCDEFNMKIWNMDFIDGPMGVGGCGKFNGGASFTGSWYIIGDWPDTKGQVSFNGGPYFVKNGSIPAGHANFGTDGHVVDIYCDGYVDPGLTNVNVHNYCPAIPIPAQGNPELSADRSLASQESSDNLVGNTGAPSPERSRVSPAFGLPSPRSGVGYKVVDNDSNVNQSITSLTLSSGTPSFGAPRDGTGASPDDFAWDAAAGVLTVRGTVFIDAQDLYLTGITWAGNGTIVCSGNVHVSGSWGPYVQSNYPSVDNVGIAASGAIDDSADPTYGAFYSAVSFSNEAAGNKATFNGEIVAPVCSWAMHATVITTPHMADYMPKSMPRGQGGIPVLSGWHEGKN